MAKLASLRQNVARITDGDWITVGFDPKDQFDILTRGQTPQYLARLNQLQREAARELNRRLPPGTQAYVSGDLPTPIANRCLGNAMAEETFLDVRRLDSDDGPVTAEQFREFLRQPAEYGATIFLAYGAMLRVHEDLQDEAKGAVKNSETASAGI